jgi:hypothetical protein
MNRKVKQVLSAGKRWVEIVKRAERALKRLDETCQSSMHCDTAGGAKVTRLQLLRRERSRPNALVAWVDEAVGG